MSNDLQVQKLEPKDVRKFLEKNKGALALALPKHVSPDRLLRVALSCINKNKKLLACTKTSLLQAIMEANQLGLEVGGYLGLAHIIPYGNQAKFQIDYKGLASLTWRSGQILSMSAEAVYEKDKFEFELGLNEKLVHVPSTSQDRGGITHFYAIVRFKTGGYVFRVMTQAEVNKVRDNHSQAYKWAIKSKDSVWHLHPVPMGKKTVFKALRPWLPLSAEIQTVLGSMDADGNVSSFNDLEDVTPFDDDEPVTDIDSDDLEDPVPAEKPDDGKKKCGQCGKEGVRGFKQAGLILLCKKCQEKQPDEPPEGGFKLNECGVCGINAHGSQIGNVWVCFDCQKKTDIKCESCERDPVQIKKEGHEIGLLKSGLWLCSVCSG